MSTVLSSPDAAPTGRPVPRPGILEISPYVPGESKAEADRVIRLASNESPIGPSPRASAAFAALADDLHRYPDGGSQALRQALGRVHDLDPARIVCGDGSDELIANLARAYAGPGDEILYSRHGFLMYPLAGLACGATLVTAPEPEIRVDVDGLLARVTGRTRIVFIANPNNPTGSYLTREELRRLHAGLPSDVVLVIDAAYAECADDVPDYDPGTDLASRFDNVVMTRTFSKLYGLGGLRLGWAYGAPDIIDVLNRVRAPFNVSSAAQAAALAAVEDQAFLADVKAHNRQWRAWTTERLTALGLTVYPSVGNFVLVDFKDVAGLDAETVRLGLKDQGILVRQMGAYGLPTCLRISIGLGPEMEAVGDALEAMVNGPKAV